MLGDTAVAVNPKDERYKHLIGRMALLPLTEREIPIIADDFVDPAFGTGMVKVTPAHDPNDFQLGQRHTLPQINIFDVSARQPTRSRKCRGPGPLRSAPPGPGRSGKGDLLQKTKIMSRVGRCTCDTVIEPYLSDQWFVRMQPLAGPALDVVMNGTIRFYPDRWVGLPALDESTSRLVFAPALVGAPIGLVCQAKVASPVVGSIVSRPRTVPGVRRASRNRTRMSLIRGSLMALAVFSA
jgi:hypothetical protein